MCDTGQRDTCNVDPADFTKTNQKVDSDDLNSIASKLRRDDLFKTSIGVSCRTARAVTITVYYTTGTVLVQGNRCTNWVQEEIRALIDTVRAINALVAIHHTQTDLDAEVDEGLRLLPQPSPDSNSMLTSNVGGDDSGVRPPFVNALLAKVILLPTCHFHKGCHVTSSPSSRPGHAALLVVCGREKASVIIHTNTFTARSGPRGKDIYRA